MITGTSPLARSTEQKIEERRALLKTDGQREFFDSIIALDSNVFGDGGGGVGKTFTLKLAVQTLWDMGKQTVLLAPTGIAAENLGGMTLARFFGWKCDLTIKRKKKDGTLTWKEMADARLYKCDVVVIDEISMVRLDMLDSVWASIQKANKVRRKTGKPDIITIVQGDYLQLKPVITPGDRARLEEFYGRPIGGGFAFSADHYDDFHFKRIKLTETVRQSEKLDKLYLNALRWGCSDKRVISKMAENFSDVDFPDAPTLFATNDSVKDYNREKMSELPGNVVKFAPHYHGELKSQIEHAEMMGDIMEIANIEKGVGSYTLEVKKGARVMFTTNSSEGVKWFEVGCHADLNHLFVNGTVGIVRDIHKAASEDDEDYVVVEIERDGVCTWVKVKRMTREIREYKVIKGSWFNGKSGSWDQIPLKVCFGLSIHKSQGSTLQFCRIDPSNIFTDSMGYVACSRAVALNHIYLTSPIDPAKITIDPEVRAFYNKLDGRPADYVPSWDTLLEEINKLDAPTKEQKAAAIPEDLRFDEYGNVYDSKKTKRFVWDADDGDESFLNYIFN